MRSRTTNIPRLLLTLCFFLVTSQGFSQKHKVDSLSKELSKAKEDTVKVALMWKLASTIYVYQPDSALYYAQEALFLAKRIGYLEGQSRSLGTLATTFNSLGNYPRALDLNFQKLKIEEKRNQPYNLASVLMNIGIVYVYQDEFEKALAYYRKADSIIEKFNVERFKWNIAVNLGDVYDRRNILDTAYIYYDKSFIIASQRKDFNSMGISLTGLGHCDRKTKNFAKAIKEYQTAINYLQSEKNDETLCEASLGLAKVYQELNKNDSVQIYARLSLNFAKQDGFLEKELDAAQFLTDHYKDLHKIDSAFAFVNQVKDLNNEYNSKSKIREAQIISTGEQFRQRELEEERKIAEKERLQQLQMLLIGIFIPGFFLLTILLNRVRIHIRIVRLLGILSLLFLFEYLTLLLHPTVARLTNHTPVFEILIFVLLAAILIPAHHKLEHWMIQKLIHHQVHHEIAKQKKQEALEKKSPAV